MQKELHEFSGWVGYISATSVYPDQESGFIDETTPAAQALKEAARLNAEREWQRFVMLKYFE